MIVPTEETKGHGTLIGTAQVGFDASGKVQVSAYGTLPVRLRVLFGEILQGRRLEADFRMTGFCGHFPGNTPCGMPTPKGM